MFLKTTVGSLLDDTDLLSIAEMATQLVREKPFSNFADFILKIPCCFRSERFFVD